MTHSKSLSLFPHRSESVQKTDTTLHSVPDPWPTNSPHRPENTHAGSPASRSRRRGVIYFIRTQCLLLGRCVSLNLSNRFRAAGISKGDARRYRSTTEGRERARSLWKPWHRALTVGCLKFFMAWPIVGGGRDSKNRYTDLDTRLSSTPSRGVASAPHPFRSKHYAITRCRRCLATYPALAMKRHPLSFHRTIRERFAALRGIGIRGKEAAGKPGSSIDQASRLANERFRVRAFLPRPWITLQSLGE